MATTKKSFIAKNGLVTLGKIGAGTLTPSTELEVVGTITATGAAVDNLKIGITTANTIDTSSGNLVLDSAGGTVSVNDDLSVSGTITGSLSGNASTASALETARTISLTGDVTGSVSFNGSANASITTAIASGSIVNTDINASAAIDYSKLALTGSIVNADVSASAAIADTKLATISTAGKVSNSATTATSSNTASAIVARDASGNFTAGTITAALSGNATTATTLQTARTINGVSFDGSANITITSTNTNALTIGTGLSGSSYNGSSAVTIEIDSTVATLTGTQTLTNKTLTDSTTTFQDETDNTKKMQFQLSGISTATTRTLTVPNVNGTIITTGDTGTVTSTMIADGTIVNDDINASAAIADTKLATISTAGKVSNSATTATSDNTASAIVARDASGNFSAGTITAALTGNASTATTLATARTISLAGDVTGSVSFNGSADVSITTTIAANSVALGTDTTGNYVATIAGTTNQVSVSGSGSETAAVTLSLPQDIHTGANPTFAGATLDAVRVGVTAANEIDTSSGNLILDSAGGTVQVDDNLEVTGNFTLTGNLIVNGSTTTVNSTVTTIDDPVMTLGGDTAPTSDDSKDRGIEFRWHNGTAAKVGFFGFDDSTGMFTFIPDATNTSEVFSGTKGIIDASLSGNASTATALQTSRTIWGQSFDGSANVTGNIDLGSSKLYNGPVSDSAGITFPSSTTRIDGYYGITFHSSANNVGSQTQRMVITSAGDVGIGTSSPTNKLHIVGSGDILRFTNGTVSLYGYSDSAGLGWFTGTGGTNVGVYYNNTSSYQSFYTSSAEQMRLTSTGLFLGHTTALANGKLQITGGIGLSGNTQIRQATNGDGNTLQVFATQFVAGSANSTSYSYAGGGLVASVSAGDSSVLLDAGRETLTDGRFKVLNTTSANTALSLEKNGVYTLYADTGSGNLGIGTSSPSVRLQLEQAANSAPVTLLRLNNSGTTAGGPGIASRISFTAGATALGFIQGSNFASGAAGLQFSGDGTNAQATLDASGNLGLGVTPSASWPSGTRAIQFGPSSALYNPGSGSRAVFASNAIFTSGISTATYITSNAAAFYDQDNGTHKWNIAPSGTAGNAISFTQAMTLDASGNLLVGTTTAASSAGVKNVIARDASVYSQWTRTSGTVGGGVIGTEGQNLVFFTHTGTVGSESYFERMRITSAGNVGIGTSSPVAALHIQTNTKSLSLASPASGGGGASYIMMGNNDSAGTAGPSMIVSANRVIQFGVGDSFSSATGGNFTEYMRIDASGNLTVSGTIIGNLSGNASTVSGLTITSSSSSLTPNNVTQNQIGYTTGVSLFSQNDGGLYSSAYDTSWMHQIFGDFRTGQIAVRGKNNGSWQAWRTILDSSNFTSYSPGLTGSGASGTWGISVTGTSSALSSSSTGVNPDNALEYFQVSSDTNLNPGADWFNTIRMGHGDPVSYYSNTLAVKMTGGNEGDIYTRTIMNGVAQSWKRHLNSSNFTEYAPSLTGSGASGTWGINVTGNSATASTLQTARTINGTSFNGSADIETTEWVHSARDFPNGTLVTTNIDYSVSSGDPWIIEIKGNSYGNQVPFDIQYQGYIYNDTIINHGGYSNGTNISGLVVLNVGGNLCFWWPNQAYWHGYNVKVYAALSTRAVNKVISITNTTKPSGTKEVALGNIRQSLHSENYNTYTPTLTGTGASGTWGINVTGTAASETLSTVTGRGASTSAQCSFTKTDDHAISVGTIRGREVGSQGGEFIHLYERVHIGAPTGWGSRAAPANGLSTYGGCLLATDTGNVNIGHSSDQGFKLAVNGSFTATSKSFLIDHPTKPGMKLRHGSLEGPEHGVYVRGKVKGKAIELPEYWTKLVDPESITVQLTSIGKHQNVYVEEIKDNVVYINNDGSDEPNVYYLIHAERIDVEKMEVEIQ